MPFKPINDPTHLYFVTSTLVEWQPLFAHAHYASIVLDSLEWHREKQRMSLFAFTIMPTHLHWVGKPTPPCSISDILESFASYTAHEILKTMRRESREDWLAVFATYAEPGKNHRIWQETEAKNVYSIEFLREKVEYTHNNAVNKGWNLVADRADYRYSSACFYDRGQEPIISIDDIGPWLT
jgi:REP element-mobilizing transposase RayT